jgi:hypothetical protein
MDGAYSDFSLNPAAASVCQAARLPDYQSPHFYFGSATRGTELSNCSPGM